MPTCTRVFEQAVLVPTQGGDMTKVLACGFVYQSATGQALCADPCMLCQRLVCSMLVLGRAHSFPSCDHHSSRPPSGCDTTHASQASPMRPSHLRRYFVSCFGIRS